MDPKIVADVEINELESNVIELGSLELALVGGGIGETTL